MKSLSQRRNPISPIFLPSFSCRQRLEGLKWQKNEGRRMGNQIGKNILLPSFSCQSHLSTVVISTRARLRLIHWIALSFV